MKHNLLITESFERYITDYISFKGQSAKTQEGYECTMKELVRRFGDVNICELTFADIRDWKLWLDKGRQPSTVRNYIVCLRVVLKFLRQHDYEVIHPESIPVPKRLNKPVDYLNETEMEHLLSHIKTKRRGYAKINRYRNYALVKLLYATGLRNAELCSLDKNSIKENTFTVVGKGSKLRIGFVDDETLDCIKDYLNLRNDSSPALFVTLHNKRMTPSDVQCLFRIIRAQTDEFRFIHPHTIRHSYATKLLKRRVDIRYVKEFMGHSNLETTAHYTHVINEDLKEIYLKAHQST